MTPLSRKKSTAAPTLRLLAESLGISVTTVSRCLSGKHEQYRIGEDTVIRVRQRAEQMNYQPNPIARGLRLKRTHTLGLVVPDIGNPFFAGIAQVVARQARAQSYSVLLCDSQDDTRQEIEAIETLRLRQVDGFIICPIGLQGEHLAALAETGLPVVLVDRSLPGIRLPVVSVDNLSGAQWAVEYLIEQGHRKIGCLCGLRGTSTNTEREQGVRLAFDKHSITWNPNWVVGESFRRESGFGGMKKLLAADGGVTAVFSFGNLISLGALDALREAKLSVPNDVSLLGFDDHPYADHLASPMSTVAQDNAVIGEQAMRLLFEQFSQGRHNSDRILVPARLLERASVKKVN